jgi:hypothetical protein
MHRKNLAFGLGMGATGLLVAEYLVIFGPALFFHSGEVDNPLMGLAAVGLLGPATATGIGLWMGRENPRSAGTLVMVMGGLVFAVGLSMLGAGLGSLDSLFTGSGLLTALMIAATLGAGGLMFASGFLLYPSEKHEF